MKDSFAKSDWRQVIIFEADLTLLRKRPSLKIGSFDSCEFYSTET